MLRTYLTEHVVMNTEAVDAWAKQWANQLSSAEGRTWTFKRFRAWILNDASLLRPLPPKNIPPQAPAFIHSAIERGDPIFDFVIQDTPAFDGFSGRCSHLIDFIKSIEDFAMIVPQNPVQHQQVNQAKKFVSKLSKMTIEQAEVAAEQWAVISMAGVKKGVKKEGVIIIHTWPDGMYAARYESKAMMQRDGQDLQNCLRSGTYWDTVESGKAWVVSIRKPNDEAVVGMRWMLPDPMQILECKGKQNQPVGNEYVPYVVDLLRIKKVGNQYNIPDLSDAGIFTNNGAYGTFRDIATKKTIGNVNTWISDSKFEAEITGKTGIIFGRASAGSITSLSLDRVKHAAGVEMLNALFAVHLTAAPSVQHDLVHNYGIFLGSSGYGSAAAAGEFIGERTTLTSRTGRFYLTTGYLALLVGDDTYLATRNESREIVSMDTSYRELITPEDFIDIINEGKLTCSTPIENSNILPWGYVNTGKGYRKIESVGKSMGLIAKSNSTLWDYKGVMLFREGNDDYVSFRLNRRTLAVTDDISYDPIAKAAVNKIVREKTVSSIDGVNPEACGVLTTKTGGLIADPATFVEVVEGYVGVGTQDMYDIRRSLTPMMASSAYHNGVADALETGIFMDMAAPLATRLFNAFNPMKLKSPILIKSSKLRVVHKSSYTDIYAFVPTSLSMFEKLWAKHPTLNSRYLKILEAINTIGLKHIADHPEGHFLLNSPNMSTNTEYHRILTPFFKALSVRAGEVRHALLVTPTPEDADASSRYQAINTRRELNKR